VKALTESTGKIDFPVLVPRGSAVRRLSTRGASADYVAARVGRAELIAHTRYCDRPVHGSCVAFVVSIS
jgi:hypothetical protein